MIMAMFSENTLKILEKISTILLEYDFSAVFTYK